MKRLKKLPILVTVLTLMLMLTSCIGEILPIPFGIWHSENPNLTLFISREPEHIVGEFPIADREHASGIFLVKHVSEDGSEIELALSYSPRPYNFVIFDPLIADEGFFSDSIYFDGRHRIRDDRLYFELRPFYRELTGFDTIVFERVEE